MRRANVIIKVLKQHQREEGKVQVVQVLVSHKRSSMGWNFMKQKIWLWTTTTMDQLSPMLLATMQIMLVICRQLHRSIAEKEIPSALPVT
mmetsp:Transcript_50911/g.133368  ORF Transcript_50911/g.133368 Transcript_50911/m.133368 type:complete len:90 (-) Transcript_50911:808-1077(-)